MKDVRSGRRVLDWNNHDPKKQLPLRKLVVRVVALAQVMTDKPFYAYQVAFTTRLVEALLNHDGDTITALFSRQSGKSESVGAICGAIALIFPILAVQYPDDWRLNITDSAGRYRGFKTGVRIGIYAPRQDQSAITFDRIRRAIDTDNSKKLFSEAKVRMEICNGNTLKLSHGSRIICQSASEGSKIEGETHDLVIIEEAQDVGDEKINKSINPMVASTMGTIVMVGTASTKKCAFYTTIQENKRMELTGGRRNHFFFPWTVCAKYNSLYERHVQKEQRKLGAQSDAFLMSYMGKWIFERGMFMPSEVLFKKGVPQLDGEWSIYYKRGLLPIKFRHYSIVAGIDWGKMHDSTVLCLMAVDWNHPIDAGDTSYDANGSHFYQFYKKHIIGYLTFQGDDYESQWHEISAFLNGFPQLRKIVTDSTGCGLPMYDRFCSVFGTMGIQIEPFAFSAKTKSEGYKSLSSDFSAGRITFPASKEVRAGNHYRSFVQQMLDLRKDYKNGLLQVAHPDEKGAHDDYPDGVMLAAWGCNNPANTQAEFAGNGSNPFF